MCQDDRCGICGKHYQACRHYLKEHIKGKGGGAICGVIDGILLPDNWKNCDIDPFDICKNCKRLYERRE